MAEKNITRRVYIHINGQEVENTLTNIKKGLAKTRALANKEVEGSDKWKEYNAEVAKLEVHLNDGIKAQRAFREASKASALGISDAHQNLDQFLGSFKQLRDGFASGNTTQVIEGWNGIKGSVKGATKAVLTFLATPIGLLVTALAGIGFASKAWLDYNTEVLKAVETTKQITGLSNSAADEARIRAESLSEAFGGDYTERLVQAKSLVTQFGISYGEAFDLIEDKLVRGQSRNEEFNDSIKEYGVFFEKAGFSATEFTNIIEKGYDLGFYKDKLPDAIKEADLALKEQTKTTRDALINALGGAFTDDVLKKVRTGAISTKDALTLIGKEAQKQKLNNQQYGQLTADVFKGAGEDAGGAAKIFETLSDAIEGNLRPLTQAEQLTKNQVKATTDLKQVTSALFFSGEQGWGLLKDKAKLFVTQGLVKILTTGVDVINWFIRLNNEAIVFKTGITAIQSVVGTVFSFVIDQFMIAFNVLGAFGTLLEGISTGNFDKLKQGASEFGEAFTKPFTNLKENVLSDIDAISKATSGATEKISLIDLGLGNQESVTNNDSEENNKEEGLTTKDQKVLDSRKKLAEELDKLAEERKIQEELKNIEESQKEEEEAILRLEADFTKLEEEAFGETELLKRLEDEKLFAIQEIRNKHDEIRAKAQEKLDAELWKKTESLNKSKIKAEESLQTAKANAWATGFSLAQQFFGKNKSLAIGLMALEKSLAIAGVLKDGAKATAAITSATGIANAEAIAASPLTAGQPWVGINTANMTASLAATKTATALSIGTIAATSIGEAASFNEGGETGFGDLGFGSNAGGFIRGVVEEGEYVIPKYLRNDPIVAQFLPIIEAKRNGKDTNSFANGGDANDVEEENEFVASLDATSANMLTNAINNLVNNGIYAKALIGNKEIKRIEKATSQLNQGRANAKINS